MNATNGRLTLRLRDWGDGTGELSAEVQSHGFCGTGYANFDLKVLRERARAFTKFPLSSGEAVYIEGGYWSKEDATTLVQEHLYVGISPVDSRGTLMLRVRLATPGDADESPLRNRISVEFNIEYQQLAKFADDLAALAMGQAPEVVLETPGYMGSV
jgi:hypothetical protein